MANLSDKIAPIGVLTPSSSIKDLSDVSSSMTPTDGQVLTYDTTNGWQAETAGALFGTVQTLTTDTTLTSGDNRNLLSCSGGITLTLPALSAGLTFGVLNTDSSNYLVLVGNTTSDLIDGHTGAAMLDPSAEAILTCDGTRWTLIGGTGKVTINAVQLTSSGSYTPGAAVQAMLVCCNGATGGTTSTTSTHKGATGGGGYSEKFYTAPFAASYAYTVGAAGAIAATGGTTTFDTMSIPSSAGSTNNVSSAGGAGSGGDFNATGGTNVSGNYNARGGGGAATRAGNGGNGTRSYGSTGGAGGGTGGNHAVYTNPAGGAAATADSASAYSLSAFVTGVTYQAGSDSTTSSYGGYGASGYTVYSTSTGGSLVIGSSTCSRGAPSWTYSLGTGFAGSPGHITILEFYT